MLAPATVRSFDFGNAQTRNWRERCLFQGFELRLKKSSGGANSPVRTVGEAYL